MSGVREGSEPTGADPAGYVRPAEGFVRDHLAAIDAAGGDTAAVDADGSAVVVIHFRGRRTGRVRRLPIIRVEHEGEYVAIASNRGADRHPQWYHSLAENDSVDVHDGTVVHRGLPVRPVDGADAETWWRRAIAAYPAFADYRAATDRQIPVLLLGGGDPNGGTLGSG